MDQKLLELASSVLSIYLGLFFVSWSDISFLGCAGVLGHRASLSTAVVSLSFFRYLIFPYIFGFLFLVIPRAVCSAGHYTLSISFNFVLVWCGRNAARLLCAARWLIIIVQVFCFFFLFSSSPILLCSCFLFLSFLFLARYLKNRKECIVSFWSATGTITITAALRRLCMIWRNFRGAMRHSTNSLWRS